MDLKKENAFTLYVIIFVLFLVSIPFLYAYLTSGSNHSFIGFLFNPIDGNSYLAKMVQGYRGEWKFKLPYTADPGKGVYMFEFYLALGHLARLFHVPLLIVFHFFRLIGGIFLLVVLRLFINFFIPDTKLSRHAFFLAAIGSGMGWIAIPFGGFTSDFWVAEAYPFLSIFANPHFPIGLGILLLLLYWSKKQFNTVSIVLYASLNFILAIINPFGVVIVWMVLGGMFLICAYQKVRDRKWEKIIKDKSTQYLISSLIGGVPVLLYDIWATKASAALSVWNTQNLTPSPPLWDVFISFSPYLLILIVLLIGLLIGKLSVHKVNYLPYIWLILGFLLLYLPVNLQRRFMMGLYIPVIISTFILLNNQQRVWGREKTNRIIMLFYILSLPTNIILMAGTINGIQTRAPMLYFSQSETSAFQWIRENTAEDALILAGPETGLYIPAQTGRRVIYGHPFETVDAEQMKDDVVNYYSGNLDCTQFLKKNSIDYVFWGARELGFGETPFSCGEKEVYKESGLTIYKVIH